MKKHIIILIALAIGAATSLITAQEGTPPPDGPPGGGKRPPGGQGGPGGQRRPSPIIQVLDLNKDGVIDADEISKASESLLKLDKNGDGKLTENEYRPPHQGGPGSGGQGHPGGTGGNNQGGPPPPPPGSEGRPQGPPAQQ